MRPRNAQQDEMIRLIEPLIPPLRRYARALMRDPSSADDLVQDCLERVISRWHQRRVDGELRSWVFAILHNLAVNRFRQNQRRGLHIAMDDADEEAFAASGHQETVLYQRDVMAALQQLTEDQRAVLLLVSVEELSYAEAASVLGVPLGTVMSRLSRGRESLRAKLEALPAEHPNRPHLRRVK